MLPNMVILHLVQRHGDIVATTCLMQISILSVFLMILWTWNFVTCKNSGILLLMEKILHQFIQWFTWFTRFYTSQLLRSLSNDLHDLQGVYTSQVVLGFLPSTVPNPSPKIFLRPHIQQSSWSAVTWTYEFVGILRLKSWWPKMTPGVNRRNKKRVQLQASTHCLWGTPNFSLSILAFNEIFKNENSRTMSLDICFRTPKCRGVLRKARPCRGEHTLVVSFFNGKTGKILYRYHSISPQVPISTAAFNSSCTKVIFPRAAVRGFEVALQQPRFTAMILQFHLNKIPTVKETSPKKNSPIKKKAYEIPEDLGIFGKEFGMYFFFQPPPKKKRYWENSGMIWKWISEVIMKNMS